MPPVTPRGPSSTPLDPRPQPSRAPPAGILASFAALLAGPPRPPTLAAPRLAPAGPPPAAGHPPGHPGLPSGPPGASHGRPASRREHPGREDRKEPEISLDPLDRALLAQRPPLLSSAMATAAPPAAPTTLVAAATPLDQLVERLLRRVALGGSKERGVAVLRVGAGPLDGAQLTITAEGRSVRVEVSGASGPEAEAWRARLEERLRQRGLDARVEVS